MIFLFGLFAPGFKLAAYRLGKGRHPPHCDDRRGIPNIKNGYWCVETYLTNVANKDGKPKIVLRFSEYKATARVDFAGEYFTYSVSGYLGVFDKTRFQAGWTDRCQQWFEYCQYSIRNGTAWSVITGGIVFRVDRHTEESLCRIYSDKLGDIARLEIWF